MTRRFRALQFCNEIDGLHSAPVPTDPTTRACARRPDPEARMDSGNTHTTRRLFRAVTTRAHARIHLRVTEATGAAVVSKFLGALMLVQ
jgi:hypothetical protein